MARPGDSGNTQSELAARVSRLEKEVARLNFLLAQNSRAAAAGAETPVPPPLSVASPAFVFPQNTPEPLPEAAIPRRASLEDRLGSQWFNRIGILLLLLGTSWFLKLAIDREWIGPVARIILGLLAGSGLVLWSERFRRQGFAPFSYSLKALGSGVLYLSLWAAFRLYGLLPAAVALTLMILVTGWNAFMAWVQDAELLAAYALAGGLATPMLLSTGGSHEIFLFTYLLALDVATVGLVRSKNWPRLLLGAFPLTVAYFVLWYVQYFAAAELVRTAAYVVLFGATFGSVPLRFGSPAEPVQADEWDAGSARTTRPGRWTWISEVALPMANAAFVAVALCVVLQDSGDHAAVPWCVLLLAVVYLGLVRAPQPRTPAAVHLSIAVVLLTIAIPLKASGDWITAGWLVEGLALVWVSATVAKTDAANLRGVRWLSAGALGLGFCATLVRLFPLVSTRNLTLWNGDIATALFGLAVLAGVIAVAARAAHARRSTEGATDSDPIWQRFGAAAAIGFNLLAVLAGVREVAAMWPAGGTADPDAALKQGLAISGFLMLYGAGLLALGFSRRSAFLRWQGLILLVSTILKTFLYDMRGLSQGYRVASFLALGALLMAVSFAYQRDWLGLRSAPTTGHSAGAEPEAQPQSPPGAGAGAER